MYSKYIKRLLDFIIALICLLILSPLLIIVIIWLHFANKGAGVFFTQKRPGKNEKIFKLYKFKSMTDECDKNGNLRSDSERLTTAGRFIRKTSIDELPQLWNVLIGDMSLIGPRPLLVRYLPFYTHREKLRHQLRPGITGYAQVNGRNYTKWDERLEKDVFYVENLSFSLDLSIMIKTLINLFKHKDVVIIPGAIGVPLDIERKNVTI